MKSKYNQFVANIQNLAINDPSPASADGLKLKELLSSLPCDFPRKRVLYFSSVHDINYYCHKKPINVSYANIILDNWPLINDTDNQKKIEKQKAIRAWWTYQNIEINYKILLSTVSQKSLYMSSYCDLLDLLSKNDFSLSRNDKKLIRHMLIITTIEGNKKDCDIVFNKINSVFPFLLQSFILEIVKKWELKIKDYKKILIKKDKNNHSFLESDLYNLAKTIDDIGRFVKDATLQRISNILKEAKDSFPTVFFPNPLIAIAYYERLELQKITKNNTKNNIKARYKKI